jgi:DNA-binding MarR family transcriptional regulator
MSARATAALLLQTGRIVQSEGYDGELSPAQWMALRFFTRANRFSRTPSAFAEFQATTRGTATQTIKALEAGGYLVRQRLENDGRSVSLQLTDKGREALARDPFEVLARAVAALDPQQRAALHQALQHVLTAVAESGGHRRFGVCSDCMHLGGETSSRPAAAIGSPPECRLLGSVIRPEEMDLLCVKFQAGNERGHDQA